MSKYKAMVEKNAICPNCKIKDDIVYYIRKHDRLFTQGCLQCSDSTTNALLISLVDDECFIAMHGQTIQ